MIYPKEKYFEKIGDKFQREQYSLEQMYDLFSDLAVIAESKFEEIKSEEAMIFIDLDTSIYSSMTIYISLGTEDMVDLVHPVLKVLQDDPRVGEMSYIKLPSSSMVKWYRNFRDHEEHLIGSLNLNVYVGRSKYCKRVPTGETTPLYTIECDYDEADL